jgi:hypothetical protein
MPVPGLRDIQAGFWRSLHTGEPDAGLVSTVLPTASLEPGARIGIYQDMYVWRLVSVLREDYPKTHEALGGDFDALARRYLAMHPSEHPSVRHLGRHLPAFLAGDELAGSRPWLGDLARLELARVNAFDAPDAVAMRATDLCAIEPQEWGDLRFDPIAALEILRCDWPAHEVWAAPERTDVAARPTRLRVWRQEFAVFHAAIDGLEVDALAVLTAGGTFAEICEAVAAHASPEAAAEQAGALLARWIDDGLMAGRRA